MTPSEHTEQTTLEDIDKVWEIERFKLKRKPIEIGDVGNYLNSRVQFPNILDMVIKMRGGKIVLPDFLKTKIEKVLKLVLDYENKLVDIDEYFCYLTINQGEVKKGKAQRNPGAHFDGMQGKMYPKKLKICHQYLVSNCNPTIYYKGGFDFSKLNEREDNFFRECDRQKKAGEQIKENLLYFQSAYQVHESPVTEKNINRTFIRIEFSLKEFNRIGNSLNPKVNTGWRWEERGIPTNLR